MSVKENKKVKDHLSELASTFSKEYGLAIAKYQTELKKFIGNSVLIRDCMQLRGHIGVSITDRDTEVNPKLGVIKSFYTERDYVVFVVKVDASQICVCLDELTFIARPEQIKQIRETLKND